MTTMTLSAKRQVVLPAELCRQVALAPGAQVRVELSPDGCGIMIQPAAKTLKKPASVLLGRVKHHGKPGRPFKMPSVIELDDLLE